MHARTNTNLPTLTQNGVSAWYAFGLWVNLVVIAVGVISTAIALILERAAKTAPGVGLLIGGLALAAFALRQADVALRRVDGVVPTLEPTGSNDDARPGHQAADARPVPYRASRLAVRC